MSQGILIAICGIDGSGKTTLAELLARDLRTSGLPVEVHKPLTPDTQFVAGVRALRDELSESVPGWYAATDEFIASYISYGFVANTRRTVVPALQRGMIVICDRYLYSHRVNQAVFGNDLGHFEPMFKLLPTPDLTFYVDVHPARSLQRIDRRGERGPFDNKEFLQQARQQFLALAPIHGFTILDGELDAEELASRAAKQVRDWRER